MDNINDVSVAKIHKINEEIAQNKVAFASLKETLQENCNHPVIFEYDRGEDTVAGRACPVCCLVEKVYDPEQSYNKLVYGGGRDIKSVSSMSEIIKYETLLDTLLI